MNSIFCIQKKQSFRSIDTGFHIQSTNNGHVLFQTSNGKYIVPNATGHMRVISDQLNTIDSDFLIKFINRPFCVLKYDFGYVAYRNKHSRILECNKSVFTLFTLEQSDDGIVYLKGKLILVFFLLLKLIYFFTFFSLDIGSDGKYWEILNDLTISVTGNEPSKFILELCSTNSRILLKAPNGMYLQAEQNGSIHATCEYNRQATQWEF